MKDMTRLHGDSTVQFLKRRNRVGGFSLVELLVTVGIIALLAGLLMVALSGVQKSGRRTQTLATMQSFLRACEAFHVEHGMNPGIIPEETLALHNHDVAHGSGGFAISGTENALLHLMGGARLLRPNTPVNSSEYTQYQSFLQTDGAFELDIAGGDWKVAINLNRLGEGPWIEGKPYPAYFVPKGGEVGVLDRAAGGTLMQWPWSTHSFGGGAGAPLPDLIDAWGNPIVYMRQARNSGTLVGAPEPGFGGRAQFRLECAWPYFLSRNQFWSCDDNIPNDPDGPSHIPSHGSIFYGSFDMGGQDSAALDKAMAMILRHPAMGGPFDPNSPDITGTPKGAIFLISAGPDGIFHSAVDGPGSPGRTIGCGMTYEEFLSGGLEAMKNFDDIIIHGGNL